MIITHSGVRTNQKTFIVAGHLFHFSGCSVLRENFYDELRALPSRTLPCPKRSLHRRSSSRKHPKETHVCNKAYLLFFPHSPSKPPKKGPLCLSVPSVLRYYCWIFSFRVFHKLFREDPAVELVLREYHYPFHAVLLHLLDGLLPLSCEEPRALLTITLLCPKVSLYTIGLCRGSAEALQPF